MVQSVGLSSFFSRVEHDGLTYSARVNPKEAKDAARLLTLQESFFVGPSSGAIFPAAIRRAMEIGKCVMVAIAPRALRP